MPAAISIDTLRFARRLTDAGMDPRHAEAIVLGLSEADTSDLATKADLAAVKAELKDDIAALRAELKDDITGVKGEVAALKAEIFRFLYLQAVGIIGITVVLIKLLP